MRDRNTTLRARSLRQTDTVAERDLWDLLRNSKLEGWKFRRQSGVAGYVVDFVCHELKLIVEVDGPHHDEPEQAEFDERRDEMLKQAGFAVLRLDEALVRREPGQAVLQIIGVGRRILAGLPALPEGEEP